MFIFSIENKIETSYLEIQTFQVFSIKDVLKRPVKSLSFLNKYLNCYKLPIYILFFKNPKWVIKATVIIDAPPWLMVKIIKETKHVKIS